MTIARSRLTGISDEASPSLAEQIRAHQRLRYKQLELRSIDGVPVGRTPDDVLMRSVDLLRAQDMSVTVIDSAVGNWSSKISAGFEQDVAEMEKVVMLGRQLRAQYIRVMSYQNDCDLSDAAWGAMAMERLKDLGKIAGDSGMALVHENCHGWAASCPKRALDLVQGMGECGIKILFDVGNPVAHGYDAMAYFRAVLPHVVHIHVKDAILDAMGEPRFTFPGNGDAPILACIDEALAGGYGGSFSIEPHIAHLPHLARQGTGTEAFETYVAYAEAFERLLGERLEPA